jgi:ABC-type spermidine/putrescine transport system permease subunit I
LQIADLIDRIICNLQSGAIMARPDLIKIDSVRQPGLSWRRVIARRLAQRPWLQLLLLLSPPAGWMLLLYLLPLAFLFLLSLWQVRDYNIVREWTLANYREIFARPVWLTVLLRTVLIAAGVTVVAAVLAFPLAYYVARFSTPRWRYLLFLAVLVPLWSSYLVRVFAWKIILGRNGILNGFLMSIGLTATPIDAFLYSDTAMFITFVHVWLPFMVLPVYTALERIPNSLLEASGDLGARGWMTFRQVIWPLAFPGIMAGSVFVFSLTMGDFITARLVGGGNQLIGNVIADQFGTAFNYPFGAALSSLALVVLFIYLLVAGRGGALENL